MSLTTEQITEIAPDQASLNAANKLMRPNKWPSLTQQGDLVWGECQGSGSNPYRTVFDQANIGYKCTCPSRKFPCKHVLALMWMYAEDPGPFSDGDVPQWVTDWLGRRRTKSGSGAPQQQGGTTGKTAPKSLLAAQRGEPEKPVDPKAEARKKAAAEKRAQTTRDSIASGIDELQQWLEDQIRSGFAAFLQDPDSRCRTIAARLVDAKAQAMAGRLDELPSRLLQTRSEQRLDALIQELGRIVLIARAWKSNRADAELSRLVGSSETRDAVLESNDAARVASFWEVVGEQVSTRRDGLVSQATWLMNLGDGLPFALLLDFFPASLGKRATTFVVGEQFEAELAFYPARQPLRAVIASRETGQSESEQRSEPKPWPKGSSQPLCAYRRALQAAPWTGQMPLLLTGGRIALAGTAYWWRAEDGSTALPLAEVPSKHIASIKTDCSVGLWDGLSLTLLSAHSELGRLSYGE